MDEMDTGSTSASASGSENRELSEEDVALSPPPSEMLLPMGDVAGGGGDGASTSSPFMIPRQR